MLRIFTTALLKTFPEIPHNHQVVRWARKPIWMPTAKSKLFRIPVKAKLPTEEADEIKRLFNNYRTAMKSIRRYLTNRYSVLLQAKLDTEQVKKAFEEDLARCQAINYKWNEDIRVQREERVAKELEKEIEFARNRIEEVLFAEEAKLKEAEEIVRREKEAAATFITRENLDKAIESAINNPVDYNFAIDLEGNQIVGRETKPPEKTSVKQ